MAGAKCRERHPGPAYENVRPLLALIPNLEDEGGGETADTPQREYLYLAVHSRDEKKVAGGENTNC